jgi:hypothetical protein
VHPSLSAAGVGAMLMAAHCGIHTILDFRRRAMLLVALGAIGTVGSGAVGLLLLWRSIAT